MSKTKVIAHRGASKAAPQNTMPAFLKAIEMGTDGFENDVHLTKDGFLVICHNYDIDETSDGSGNIADMTLEELRQYDFGSYFSPDFEGTKIPTLDEFLAICKGLDVINIEIKSPPQKESGIEKKVIDAVKDFGLAKETIISSFDKEVLLNCKKIDPGIKTGFLYSTDSPYEEVYEDPIAFAKGLGADALHPLAMFVDEDYIIESHEAGLLVNPWTVDKDYAIERLRDWNCDGVITNLPDLARRIIG